MSPTVLITGASRGIGLGLVKEYLNNNWNVLATCRNPSKASELSTVLKNANQPAPFSCDVTDDTSIKNCFDSICKQVQSVNMIINNAGISNETHPEELPSKIKRDELLSIMNTNVGGIVVVTQTFMPLLQGDQKKIVNISSGLGLTKIITAPRSTSYCCSKAAVNMLTKIQSLEWTDVTFLAVHPGWVQTDMGKSGNRSPPVSIEESASGIYNVAQKCSKEQSGNYWNWTGEMMEL